MQWLIDIITEIVGNHIGYFYRGDPAVHDFDLLDLTLDGNWHDLDLSTIVPAGAKAVSLITNIRSDALYSEIKFRRKGQVNAINSLTLWAQSSALRLGGVFPVNIDANRVVEYKADAVAWTLIKISVSGWWLR